MFQPKHLLVTGGAGFIGCNFIRYLLKQWPACKIVNLDNLTYAGSLENIKDLSHLPNYHFIQGNICDKQHVSHILEHHSIDTIVHFAAESHVDRSIQGPALFVETNLVGTYTLLEAARHLWLSIEKRDAKQCRFHHISTDEVYGSLQLGEQAFTEETAYQPRSPYSATKAGSDHLVQAYSQTYGLPTTLSNCSNNYGPYQHEEKFIPTIIRACLKQEKIPVYGNGKNIRDWLYVDDHCEGVLEILKRGTPGEKYLLGGNNEWENLKLAHYICEQMDIIKPAQKKYAHLIEFVTDRLGHDLRYAVDCKKMRHEFNWQPRESFATGIKKTIDYYAKKYDVEFA